MGRFVTGHVKWILYHSVKWMLQWHLYWKACTAAKSEIAVKEKEFFEFIVVLQRIIYYKLLNNNEIIPVKAFGIFIIQKGLIFHYSKRWLYTAWMTKYVLELHWEQMPHQPFSADIPFFVITIYSKVWKSMRSVQKQIIF